MVTGIVILNSQSSSDDDRSIDVTSILPAGR